MQLIPPIITSRAAGMMPTTLPRSSTDPNQKMIHPYLSIQEHPTSSIQLTKKPPSPPSPPAEDGPQAHVIDLRSNHPLKPPSNVTTPTGGLRQEILDGLTNQLVQIPGQTDSDLQFSYRKSIPTVVLYDDLGLELYDQITTLEDYYPFATELGILQANGQEIAQRLAGLSTTTSPTSTSSSALNQNKPFGFPFSIVELGAGSLKKTSYLLRNVAVLLQPTARQQSDQYLSRAEYYALDLEYGQLVSTLTAIQLEKNSGVGPNIGSEVQTRGICGTYNQGLEWIAQSMKSSRKKSTHDHHHHRKAILWLGSSIGNLSPSEAIEFLKHQLKPVLDSQTRVLIGIDNCKIPEKVQRAYDDRKGITRQFILNAVRVVARQLGLSEGSLRPDQFDYVSRYNVAMSRNEAYLRARENIVIIIPSVQKVNTEVPSTLIRIEAGELISIERSYKYSNDQVYHLFDQAGLRVIQTWSDLSDPSTNPSNASKSPTHTLYLVEIAPFNFTQNVSFDSQNPSASIPSSMNLCKSEQQSGSSKTCDKMSKELSLQGNMFDLPAFDQLMTASKRFGNVPTKEDWFTLWSAWDTVTLGMIPKNKLYCKPIELRHICLFYLGHIPVFADIHLSRYFGQPQSEPQWFSEIFERGIDPVIQDPSQCHDHSRVPEKEDEWPLLEQIISFRDALRQRLLVVCENLAVGNDDQGIKSGKILRSLGRMLSMIYEHEAMHLETLLYMLVQSTWVKPPPGFTTPDWGSLSRQWDLEAERENIDSGGEDEVIEFDSTREIMIGHDDQESDDQKDDKDLELGLDEEHEFGWDNENPKRKVEVKPFKMTMLPISQLQYLGYLKKKYQDGKFPAKEIPGSWEYEYLPLKLLSSSSSSCSIEEPDDAGDRHQIQIKTVYGLIDFKIAQHWPVQGSGRQLEGFAKSKKGRLPTSNELRLFRAETTNRNRLTENPIGFKQWHPVPARKPIKQKDQWIRYGSNGGVWEWTRSEFQTHDGFRSSSSYPGYSQDFFDGLHYELVGGSWATIPRIANRESFVNWYQFDYPFVFSGGRVAYDY